MFCVSDRLHPTQHHQQFQQSATIFIPAAYDQQAVATMMMSVLTSGQTLMANIQPTPVPPLPPPSSLALGESPKYSGLSPTKLKAARRQQVHGTAMNSRDGTADRVTSFRIADILDWSVGSSGRRTQHRVSRTTETTALETKHSEVTTSIVRPWDERSSSSSPSSTSSVEEEPNDDDEAAEIDVDDASCSVQSRTTSSDMTLDHDVCPLGALLRMTSQTNFDECANRLQECFNNGRYTIAS